MDSRESKQISMELDEKRSELQSVNEELANAIEKAEDAAKLLDRIKNFVLSFRLFAPTIEEYANHVEADKIIEAGNSFRGIFYEIGKLLETFKELIKEGYNGFLYNRESSGDLAQKIILLRQTGHLPEMKQNALKSVENRFSIPTFAEEFISIINSKKA
jgi:hypothetical protein